MDSAQTVTYPSLHFWYSGLYLGGEIGGLAVVLQMDVGRGISIKYTEVLDCVVSSDGGGLCPTMFVLAQPKLEG